MVTIKAGPFYFLLVLEDLLQRAVLSLGSGQVMLREWIQICCGSMVWHPAKREGAQTRCVPCWFNP